MSKVVQNIANGIVAEDKESFLKPLNDFTASRIEKNRTFMTKMAAKRPSDTDLSFNGIRMEELCSAQAKLVAFVLEQHDLLISHSNDPSVDALGVRNAPKKGLVSAIQKLQDDADTSRLRSASVLSQIPDDGHTEMGDEHKAGKGKCNWCCTIL